MLSIVTRRAPFYTRQEIWFYSGEAVASAHNDLFYESFIAPAFEVDAMSERQTSVLDLTRPASDLFGEIWSGFRTDIRRAEREGASHHVDRTPSAEALRQYVDSYQTFAGAKGLGPLDFGRLAAFSRHQALCITTGRFADAPLTIHSYLVDPGERARLLYSHHVPTNVADDARARVNKFHHWQDLLFFQGLGIRAYDFGGIDLEATAGIARFKLAFGGRLETLYSFQRMRGLYGYVSGLRGAGRSGWMTPTRRPTR